MGRGGQRCSGRRAVGGVFGKVWKRSVELITPLVEFSTTREDDEKEQKNRKQGGRLNQMRE